MLQFNKSNEIKIQDEIVLEYFKYEEFKEEGATPELRKAFEHYYKDGYVTLGAYTFKNQYEKQWAEEEVATAVLETWTPIKRH